jgi:hypothetical protein
MEVTADKAEGKTSSAERKIELSDIRSSMRRTTARRDKYHDKLVNNFPTITDPDARHLAITNHKTEENKAISELADLKAQEQSILSGRTLPAQPAAAPEGQTPFSQPNTSFQPPAETQPTPPVPSAAGGENISPDLAASGLRMPAPTPFDEFRQQLSAKLDAELQPKEAAAMPASNGKFFISGQNGKPDLTNYGGGRSEADAAWAARTTPRINPPADTAPVEPTAATVMADQAKPTAAGKNTPIDSQEAYDALASGDQYLDAQGNLRRKK